MTILTEPVRGRKSSLDSRGPLTSGKGNRDRSPERNTRPPKASTSYIQSGSTAKSQAESSRPFVSHPRSTRSRGTGHGTVRCLGRRRTKHGVQTRVRPRLDLDGSLPTLPMPSTEAGTEGAHDGQGEGQPETAPSAVLLVPVRGIQRLDRGTSPRGTSEVPTW